MKKNFFYRIEFETLLQQILFHILIPSSVVLTIHFENTFYLHMFLIPESFLYTQNYTTTHTPKHTNINTRHINKIQKHKHTQKHTKPHKTTYTKTYTKTLKNIHKHIQKHTHSHIHIHSLNSFQFIYKNKPIFEYSLFLLKNIKIFGSSFKVFHFFT